MMICVCTSTYVCVCEKEGEREGNREEERDEDRGCGKNINR